MAVAAKTISLAKSAAYKTILLGGLIAGSTDITSAFIHNGSRGRSPLFVLQFVASGLLGADSYNDGWRSAALGLLCHFVIATGATAVFYAVSRKLTFLIKQPVISGMLYGLAVFGFMNYVVIPLSAIGHVLSYVPLHLVIGLLIHMFCVGLPMALVVRWLSK
jgi:hypothetical protein